MLNLPIALINIKMPFLKNREKWKGKVNPIYKIEWDHWNDGYRIAKYVLCYHKYDLKIELEKYTGEMSMELFIILWDCYLRLGQIKVENLGYSLTLEN